MPEAAGEGEEAGLIVFGMIIGVDRDQPQDH